MSSDDFQIICIDLLGSPIKYRLIACYVPPNLNVDTATQFLNIFESDCMISTNATTIICGDFKLPSNRGLSRFCEALVEKGFSQYVNSPTRGDNSLDLVFVNDDFAVSGVVVGPHFQPAITIRSVLGLFIWSHLRLSRRSLDIDLMLRI